MTEFFKAMLKPLKSKNNPFYVKCSKNETIASIADLDKMPLHIMRYFIYRVRSFWCHKKIRSVVRNVDQQALNHINFEKWYIKLDLVKINVLPQKKKKNSEVLVEMCLCLTFLPTAKVIMEAGSQLKVSKDIHD